LAKCFSRLTIIRLSLQNSESGACSANNVYVVWDPIKVTKLLKYYKMIVSLSLMTHHDVLCKIILYVICLSYYF